MNKVNNPYGQHYLCVCQLFDSKTLTILFTHLLNRHMAMVRSGKRPIISIQGSKMEYITRISRRSISSQLAILESMGVIQITDRSCIVNADYFVSVVTLFNQQNTVSLKTEVEKAFREHDLTKLSELGLNIVKGGNDELLSLNGSIQQNDDSCVNVRTIGNTSHNGNYFPNCEKLPTMGNSSHNGKYFPNCEKVLKVGSISHKMQLFNMISETFNSKSGKYFSLCEKLPTENAKNFARQIGDCVFNDEQLDDDEIDGAVYGLLGELLASKWEILPIGAGNTSHFEGEKWEVFPTE